MPNAYTMVCSISKSSTYHHLDLFNFVKTNKSLKNGLVLDIAVDRVVNPSSLDKDLSYIVGQALGRLRKILNKMMMTTTLMMIPAHMREVVMMRIKVMIPQKSQ